MTIAAFAWKQLRLRREIVQDNLSELVRGLPGPVDMTDNDLLMQLWHYLSPETAARLRRQTALARWRDHHR